MKRSFGRFLSNRRGAFAMQFALMVVPLFICTGLAIDGGRAFLARFELGSALDAAALAAGSTVGDQAALDAVARNYVDKNYRQAKAGSVTLKLTPGTDMLTLDGSVPMDTFFMPIVGIKTINVSAQSEVKRGGTDLEVSLVLDTTGSMKGQRLTDLKSAATDLVNAVVNDAQTPHYSRLALVTYGDNVYVGSHADAVRGAVTAGKAITGATWKNGAAVNITGIAWTTATAKNITNITKASPAVFTSTGHGLATGDYIWVTGTSITSLNKVAYKVTISGTDKFTLTTLSGGSVNTSSSATNGSWTKCASAKCELKVTTSTGFTNGDAVIIQGVTGVQNSSNVVVPNSLTPWIVANATTTPANTFTLTGTLGPADTAYTSGGTVQKCFTTTCEVKVTLANYGYTTTDYVAFDGVGGMTPINWSTTAPNSWLVKTPTTNDFILTGTTGPTYSDWTSAGTAYCTNFKCKYYRYQNLSLAYVTRPVSQCVTERIGDDAYTDTDPATSPVGWNYPGYVSSPKETLAGCRSTGAFIPLNSGAAADVRKTLTDAIAGLTPNDSTAGEVGLAWGWYMLSPNFGSLWTGTGEVSPKAYGSENLAKVMVMMTDGEFNTANYNGINANDYSAATNADRINHASSNGDPWAQADALCAAAKKKNITIYTVGFGTDLDGSDATHLQNCATVPGNAYLASTGADLKTAFAQIAKSIALLRLSK